MASSTGNDEDMADEDAEEEEEEEEEDDDEEEQEEEEEDDHATGESTKPSSVKQSEVSRQSRMGVHR